MTRLGTWIAVCALALLGCGRGASSNVPPTIRTQLRAERGCEPSNALLVSSTPTSQVWQIDGCGERFSLTCPVVRGSLGQCGSSVGGVAGAAGATAEAPNEAPTAPPTPTGEPVEGYADDPDAELRAAIDARADAVLRCTQGAPTAVDVSWTIDGAVEVTLTGALADTPAELCAGHALEELPIPEGEAGRLRHPIREP